jgi:signal transduction histidine kinase
LAQEARSAAQKLRQGVGLSIDEIPTRSGPSITGSPVIPPPPPAEEITGGVEGTLDRLDEAVSLLVSLHGHPQTRGRRGKIDLAALIWEIAPEARVQLEMGEGTNVFGDEAELRRVLHVMIGQAGDPHSSRGAPSISVKRNGDELRVAVMLGPDTPAAFETERAWLSRMATRYGGRLELDGSMQTLVLPADIDQQRRELETLKKELAAAQAQGEAIARELAAAVGGGASVTPQPPNVSEHARPTPHTGLPSHMPGSEGLGVLVAAARAVGTQLRGILSAIGRDMSPLRDRNDEAGEIALSVARHTTAGSEIVADLARLGACPIGELPRLANVAEMLRDVVRSDLVRGARHDVRVQVNAPDTIEDVVPAGALTVLLHALLDHAIDASPGGSEVEITLTEEANGIVFTFDDAGPALPASARAGVLSRDFEAITQGRAAGLSLIAAFAIATQLHMPIEIDDAPRGGTRVRVTLVRVDPG